jgi:hypothetical protein
MLLLLVGLTAIDAVSTQARCLDAARDIALAVARGEPRPDGRIPAGGQAAVSAAGERVSVEVSAPVFDGWRGGLTVSARAVAAVEQ